MIRIYILIGLSFLVYYGYDGLRGDSTLKTMSLTELETQGVGDSRYLEITDCFTTGVFVYEYEDDNKDRATSVIFPVINSDAFLQALLEGEETDTTDLVTDADTTYSDTDTEVAEKVTTHLLIKRSAAKFKAECAEGDGSCTQDLLDYIFGSEEYRGFTVRGTTRIGLDDLEEKDRELIQSLNYNLADKVVYLEEDSEPRGAMASILMIAGGILGMLITVGTWFAGRASSAGGNEQTPPAASA